MAHLDTRDYLRQLIDHYDHLLENKSLKSPVLDLHTYIKEERNLCWHKLRVLLEADTEAQILANASAYHSRITKQV